MEEEIWPGLVLNAHNAIGPLMVNHVLETKIFDDMEKAKIIA